MASSAAPTPPSIPPLPPRTPAPKKYPDDMNDTVDLHRYESDSKAGWTDVEPLHLAIRIVHDKIFPSYTKFDRLAMWYQQAYQNVSIGAVTFGAASVFFAVVEVMKLILPKNLDARNGEIFAVVLTLAFIAAGLAMKFKESWILSRYKAENLRLLKFRKLTDPKLWCDPPDLAASASELEEEVREISAQNYEAAKEWAAKGVHPRVAAPPCEGKCPNALHELVDYYIPKRLDVQINYLERKSGVVERRGLWTSMAVRLLFWVSFAFVLCHVVVSSPRFAAAKPARTETTSPTQQGHKPSPDDYFALAALFLPIVAAAIRTHRAAHEYERTALRHRATLDSLLALSHKLRDAKLLDQKFQLVGFCELILEADCREFLRLVSEAEWYG
jgi:hypothetical protein